MSTVHVSGSGSSAGGAGELARTFTASAIGACLQSTVNACAGVGEYGSPFAESACCSGSVAPEPELRATEFGLRVVPPLPGCAVWYIAL